MKSTDSTPQRKPAAKDVILDALPATARQIMAHTSSAKSTIQKHLSDLMASRAIYIRDWETSPTGHALAVYAVGDDAHDAPRGEKQPAQRKSRAALSLVPGESIVQGAIRLQGQAFALAGVWA